MISFRYHLVSVIAVFLALALGVVIGTSALNGAVVGDLRRQVSDLKSGDAAAAARNHDLQAQADDADLLAQTFGARITGQSLAKVPVVLVGAPGATKSMKDAIAAQITAAGGTVAGRLQISGELLDPKRANDIRSLATSNVHPMGLQLPATDDPGMLAGALVGFVLFGHGQSTDLAQVLASFSTLNMIKAESANPAAGKALVLVAPGARPKNDPGAATLQTFATEVAAIGGPTVVAGDQPSSTAGGLIALVRGNDTAKKALSTIDDATSPLGTLTVVLALADAVAGRKGNYGVGPGADALLPGVSS
ncbi:MAG TPA: copper transporter [Jatrophihabitans sp.]|nr:copper transporter [Jatrophihabitans sp.]